MTVLLVVGQFEIRCGVHWLRDQGDRWHARPEARIHVLRRAPEPDHADVDAPLFPLDAFSKKLENHAAMVALYFLYYNFGRVHQTLRVTPAMEAELADHVWAIEEIVGLIG